MIQYSDEKYWKRMNWYDGLLYLSLLEIDGHKDWRYPSKKECPIIAGLEWYLENGKDCSDDMLKTKLWWVVPVREETYD